VLVCFDFAGEVFLGCEALDEGGLSVGELLGEVLDESVFTGGFFLDGEEVGGEFFDGVLGRGEVVLEVVDGVGEGLGGGLEVGFHFGLDVVVLGDFFLEFFDGFFFVFKVDVFQDDVHPLFFGVVVDLLEFCVFVLDGSVKGGDLVVGALDVLVGSLEEGFEVVDGGFVGVEFVVAVLEVGEAFVEFALESGDGGVFFGGVFFGLGECCF